MINSKVSEKGSLIKMKENVMGTVYIANPTADGIYDLSIVDIQSGQIFLLIKESDNESIVLVPGCGQVHFPTYVDNLPMEAAEAQIYPVYEHVQNLNKV
tara:strand:- start:147 stop:443 length:297 start_codon:yes stop_codon:yes gene_type:complete